MCKNSLLDTIYTTISNKAEMTVVVTVEFAHARPVSRATLLTVNSTPSYPGVYLTLATVTIIGLVCMVGWNGMDFSVQQSLILNPWGNRYAFVVISVFRRFYPLRRDIIFTSLTI